MFRANCPDARFARILSKMSQTAPQVLLHRYSGGANASKKAEAKRVNALKKVIPAQVRA
jgi:hypothetical protein